MEKKDMLGMTRDGIRLAVENLGFPAFRAGQVFGWLYNNAADSIEAMKNIPKEMKAALEKEYYVSTLKKAITAVSRTDGTIKYLFKLEDGEKIESVLLPDDERQTLCISSQAGCACACGFCATGTLGLKRSLTAGEILNQFIYAGKLSGKKIDNIVFMGMGEPLLNWENVKRAIEILGDEKGFNFSQYRITVSTIGVVPVIKEIAKGPYKFGLAISLISADDTIRSRIVPMNKKYPLADIIAACRVYNKEKDAEVTFEYPMFDGVNDTITDAHKLLDRLKGVKYKVNLIPYNSVKAFNLNKPSREKVAAFQNLLRDAGINTFIRKEKGADIAGACGQLAAEG
ncbi:MAG: 23S rRNA (adenine(2503)-C(2))-methyltransferase RlmN [Spirochaetia bacterium]|nr:23S rRNA (adenine(2503)-C(2))-methyltransferase RlmN [Spirochaetia bacterium]